ncbi:hypothetical protein G6F60_015043 [Rhizopus arrhizus]|nr:hypothetical protein G6F60_015043 [Rhizopus arrhizus]
MIQRGFGATALKQGVLTSDTPNTNWGWFGSNLLPFYTYTETSGAGYVEFVDMGNGFSWDLNKHQGAAAKRAVDLVGRA